MTRDADRKQIAAELFATTPASLGSYFGVFDSLIARSDVHVLQIETPDPGQASPVRAITHNDIFIAARILRGNPTLTLDKAAARLRKELGTTCSAQQSKLTMLISVRAMLMIDCIGPGNLWRPSESFDWLGSRTFPRYSDPISNATREAMKNQRSMKAWKLKSRFGISFRGTDDLARHLLLDPSHPDGPTLYLFHYTGFLKAQLDKAKQEKLSKDAHFPECLTSGCLPPRLLAETLHSLQAILFHFDDHRSSRILERLTAKHGFDEDCAQAEGYKMFDDADLAEYVYWGWRLAALHGLMRERPPRNKFERWMKWQTSESNAFAVALAALLISIVIGILSLGLAAFQAWIAWVAWQESVADSDDETIALLREIADLLRQRP